MGRRSCEFMEKRTSPRQGGKDGGGTSPVHDCAPSEKVEHFAPSLVKDTSRPGASQLMESSAGSEVNPDRRAELSRKTKDDDGERDDRYLFQRPSGREEVKSVEVSEFYRRDREEAAPPLGLEDQPRSFLEHRSHHQVSEESLGHREQTYHSYPEQRADVSYHHSQEESFRWHGERRPTASTTEASPFKSEHRRLSEAGSSVSVRSRESSGSEYLERQVEPTERFENLSRRSLRLEFGSCDHPDRNILHCRDTGVRAEHRMMMPSADVYDVRKSESAQELAAHRLEYESIERLFRAQQSETNPQQDISSRSDSELPSRRISRTSYSEKDYPSYLKTEEGQSMYPSSGRLESTFVNPSNYFPLSSSRGDSTALGHGRDSGQKMTDRKRFYISSMISSGEILSSSDVAPRVSHTASSTVVREVPPSSLMDQESLEYTGRDRGHLPPSHGTQQEEDPRWRYTSDRDSFSKTGLLSLGSFPEKSAARQSARVPLVPNIIIEPAPSGFHYSHSLTPPLSHPRVPAGPHGPAGSWSGSSSSQKVRAYSDSAMYNTDRYAMGFTESPLQPVIQAREREGRIFIFEQPGASTPSLGDKIMEDKERRIVVKMDEGDEDLKIVFPFSKASDLEEKSAEEERESYRSKTSAYCLSPTMSKQLEESESKCFWLRRNSDSSVLRDDNDAQVGDQTKQLSVSDSRIIKEEIKSEPLRTFTSSTISSQADTTSDFPGSLSHRKVKKYLQAKWFESRKSESPESSETGIRQSVERDDVFVEPTQKLMELSPDAMRPRSCSGPDDNLSPASFHSADSQMLAEVSPSAYVEATRICDDPESHEPMGGRDESSAGTQKWRGDHPYKSESRQYFSDRIEEESPCSGGTLSSSQSLFYPTRTQHSVFTFPASISSLEQLTTTQNPFSRSFSLASPLVPGTQAVPVSTPPSPLIPSPHGIRKYGTQGSAVSPSMMCSRDDSSTSVGPSRSEIPHRFGDVPTSLRYHPLSPVHRPLQKSPLPGHTEAQRLHQPARRIQSLETYYETMVPSIVSSAPPSPVVSDIPISPQFSRQMFHRGGRYLVSSPFLARQQRHEPRFEHSVTSSSSSTTSSSRSSSSSNCFVCPVCSIPFTSYSSLASHMAVHVPESQVHASGSLPQGEEGRVAGSSAPTGDPGSNLHLCKVCKRSFSRSDMLSRHMRLHTGHRPYECDLCGQVFSRSDHLHTHQRTHTGEKPYHCKYCVYAAPRRDMVTRHMRVHMRESTGPRRGRRSQSASSNRAAHHSRGRGSEIEGEMASPRTLSSSSSSSSRGYSSTASSRRHLSDLSISRGRGGLESLAGREGGLIRARNWSLTSSAASSDVGSELSPLYPPFHPLYPPSGRGLSSSRTLSEGSEMYPSPGYAGPSPAIWSPCTDSPAEVFTPSLQHHPRHFIWPTVPLASPIKSDTKMEMDEEMEDKKRETESRAVFTQGFGSVDSSRQQMIERCSPAGDSFGNGDEGKLKEVSMEKESPESDSNGKKE